MGKLLHEEGVPRCLAQDEVAKLGDDLPFGEDGLDEFGACRDGELIDPDSGVRGLASPSVGVFGSVEDDEEYGGMCEPADEVVQELFRGLVDPVEVLDDEDKGCLLALPDEEVSQGLEDPLPLLLGLEVAVFFIGFEGEEVLKRGNRCDEMLIEGRELLLHLLVDEILPLSFLDPEV